MIDSIYGMLLLNNNSFLKVNAMKFLSFLLLFHFATSMLHQEIQSSFSNVNFLVFLEESLLCFVDIFLHLSKIILSSFLLFCGFIFIRTSIFWTSLGKIPLVSKCGLGIFQVALGGDDIMVNAEIWDKVVFVVVILISLQFLWGCSLCFSHTFWEYGWIAGWDGLLLRKLPLMPNWGLSILQIALSGDDIMINTKVWHEVIFVVMVHISLELLWSSSLCLFDAAWEYGWVTCWDGLVLSKFPLVSNWSLSILQIALSGDDIMINTKVWYEIIFVVVVHISLKFLWSSSLCLFDAPWEYRWVTSWNGLVLSKFPGMFQASFSIFQVTLGSNNVMVYSKVWDEVVFVVVILISLQFLWGCSLCFGDTFWENRWITCWDGLVLSEFPLVPNWGLSILQIALSGDDIMINAKVWDEVVFVVVILISLQFLWGCSLCFGDTFWENRWITCWDRLVLSEFPLMSNWCFSILQIALGSDNIVVNSKVRDKVIFIMMILVFLELGWCSCFSLSNTFWENWWVASWNRSLLRKVPCMLQ